MTEEVESRHLFHLIYRTGIIFHFSAPQMKPTPVPMPPKKREMRAWVRVRARVRARVRRQR